jgi:hypothetical protein
VVSRVACLPEMAAGGTRFLAEPGDERSLTQAILLAADMKTSRSKGAAPRSWLEVGEEWSHWVAML